MILLLEQCVWGKSHLAFAKIWVSGGRGKKGHFGGFPGRGQNWGFRQIPQIAPKWSKLGFPGFPQNRSFLADPQNGHFPGIGHFRHFAFVVENSDFLTFLENEKIWYTVKITKNGRSGKKCQKWCFPDIFYRG